MFYRKIFIGIFSTILVLPIAPVSQSQAANGLLTAILCFADNAIVFYDQSSKAPKQGAKSKLIDVIYDPENGTSWDGGSEIEISLGDAENGNCNGFFNYANFPQKGVVSQELLDEVEIDSQYSSLGYPYADLGIKVGKTRYSIIHATSGLFNPTSPGLFVIDYGSGGGSLSGEDGYSSDGTFIGKIYPTQLPQIFKADGVVICSAGKYRSENLNRDSEIANASYRISLHSETGELVSTSGTSESASFDVTLLPKNVSIWCQVEVNAANRVALIKSTDDFQAMNGLKLDKKLKLRAVKLSIIKGEVADSLAALEKAETDFLDRLTEKKFAVVLP